MRTKLRVEFGTDAYEREALAETLSEGGVYINTNEVYRSGTRLRVRIEFPDRTVHHSAEVVWAIRVPEHQRAAMMCGMGLSFLDPDPGWAAFFRRWRETELAAS